MNWFLRFLRLTTFVCSIGGAFLPLLAGLGGGNPYLLLWYFGLLGVGVASLVLHSLFRRHRVVDRTYDFLRELLRAPYVWIVAFWVGGVFAALFMGIGWSLNFLQYPGHWGPLGGTGVVQSLLKAPGADVSTFPWREQAVGAFGALLTGVSMVVVVGTFYRRLAPYTDLWDLMEELERDIREQERLGGERPRVWWAYPGFALGRYRSLTADGKPGLDNGRYKRFRDKLAILLASENVSAIVYDERCIDAFYAAYYLQNSEKYKKRMAAGQVLESGETSIDIAQALQDARVQVCVAEEKALFGSARAFSTDVYVAHSPEAIQTYVIVIGDVVYQIANYGSPIYMDVNPASQLSAPCNEIGGVFFPSDGGGDHLLKLVAFRRHDRAYADTVVNHLRQHANAALNLGIISH